MPMKRNHYADDQEQFRDTFRRFLAREVIPHRRASANRG